MDLSKLNLDWLLKRMKALEVEIEKVKDSIPVIPEPDPEPEPALTISDVYNSFNSSAWLEASTELIGAAEIPAGHTVCSAEYYNGHLFIAHHQSDIDLMWISKYTYPNLALVNRASIDVQMHGNGLGSDPTRGVLILSNGWNDSLINDQTLYMIDPNSLQVVKRFDYGPFGVASLSTFDVSPDGTSAAALLTGSNKVLEYDVNPDTNVASAVRIHNLPEVGDGIRQDGSLTNTFYYQLFSNDGLPKYSQNQIVIYSFRTGYFKTLYLKNTGYDELEGLSRINITGTVGLILVDVNGKVYFCNTSDKIIASGLLTKADAVCAGTPQYQVTNPQQLRKQSVTNTITVSSDTYNITADVFISTPCMDLHNYSLRSLSTSQDAHKVHFGWYYATLAMGDRYFLTGVINTLRGGTLLVRYGYYDSIGGIQIQRCAYRDSTGNITNALYDGTDTTDLIAVIKAFIDDNHNEMQENVIFAPEIWNVSEYVRTSDIWNIPLDT